MKIKLRYIILHLNYSEYSCWFKCKRAKYSDYERGIHIDKQPGDDTISSSYQHKLSLQI